MVEREASLIVERRIGSTQDPGGNNESWGGHWGREIM